MKLIAFGDIHERTINLELIGNEISTADILIITGDLTQFGGLKDAQPIIEKLRSLNSNTFIQAGNLDDREVENYLQDLGISLHGRGHIVEDMGIFGCGGGNPSPFNTPNELGEDDIAEILQRGYEAVRDCPVRIMAPHAPPFDTKVDVVHSGLHVGSKAVRNFIEKYEPHLCLTGHIHEAAGEDSIGKTKVLNPGPFYDGGYIVVNYNGTELTTELRFLA